jgi:hypothetical protein
LEVSEIGVRQRGSLDLLDDGQEVMKGPDGLKGRPGRGPDQASGCGQKQGGAERRERDGAVEEEAGEIAVGTAESIGSLG